MDDKRKDTSIDDDASGHWHMDIDSIDSLERVTGYCHDQYFDLDDLTFDEDTGIFSLIFWRVLFGKSSWMKDYFLYRLILVLMLPIICLPSVPNFERYAQIVFVAERSCIDLKHRLWAIGTEWHTRGTYPYSLERIVPYLHFWLYDQEGKLVNEGIFGDSVEGCDLFALENGGALVIWYCRTDINVRMGDPTSGYVRASYINDNGILMHEKIVTLENANYHILGEFTQGILVGLGHMYSRDRRFVRVDNDTIIVAVDPYDVPRCNVLHQIDSTRFLAWAWVDSVVDYGYDETFDRTYPIIVTLYDQIAISKYDMEWAKWETSRFSISDASFRKYVDLDIDPLLLSKVPWFMPVQAVELENGNIVVTVFTVVRDKSVAYQIAFDPQGDLIPFDEVVAKQPVAIEEIPTGGSLFIKLGRGVRIWGYDRKEGLLYWRSYFKNGSTDN